jgi:hypothetical protein
MTTPSVLPPVPRLLSRLIPADERQAIIGDLIEDAGWRGLTGGRLTLALCTSCGAIAAGLAVDRVRASLVMPPAAELVTGLAIEGGRTLRSLRGSPRTLLGRAAAFAAAVALLACGVGVLVSALMSAAGLRL